MAGREGPRASRADGSDAGSSGSGVQAFAVGKLLNELDVKYLDAA